ncbi:MAG: hypothetical protein QNJ91_06995 [Gammaproteobacteria bacterium]|nr:hypothetical protein [Gammaproteobacteria bacterium]
MSDTEDPRISALYRRAPRAEPTADSDAAILDAARRAARRSRRRYAPWAVAATLVLGVGIGWRVLHVVPPDEVAPVSVPVPPTLPAQQAAPAPTPAAEVAASPSVDGLTSEADRAGPPAVRGAPAAVKRQAAESGVAPSGRDGETRSSSAFGRVLEPRAVTDSVDSASAPLAAAEADCEQYWPAADATAEAWRELIRQARADGDERRARCLLVRYRALFAAPADSLSSPVPGR